MTATGSYAQTCPTTPTYDSNTNIAIGSGEVVVDPGRAEG